MQDASNLSIICWLFVLIILPSYYLPVQGSEFLPDVPSTTRNTSALLRMRTGRFLDLLGLVNLNLPSKTCKGSVGGSTGRCSTHFECTKKGASVDGTCASGFGVCCVQELSCGASVKYNETYLVNDGFPMTTSMIMNCLYDIQKVNIDVCQLRLDFETLVLAGPENNSLCREDKLSITSGTGEPSFVLCGVNSGQHVYLDMSTSSGPARINIGLTTSTMDRTWRIRVSQISCTSPYKAPENCLQYFTEYSATIQSFNFKNGEGVNQIGGLRYTICVRARDGFCGITYKSNSFSLSGNATATVGVQLSGDVNCTKDFLLIPSLPLLPSSAIPHDRYCGTEFTEKNTFSRPFQLRVVTDEDENSDVSNRGFSLTYTQIPC